MSNSNIANDVHIGLIELFTKPEDSPICIMSHSILENPKGNIGPFHFYVDKKRAEIDDFTGGSRPSDQSKLVTEIERMSYPLLPNEVVFFDIPKEGFEKYLGHTLPSYLKEGYNLRLTVLSSQDNEQIARIDSKNQKQLELIKPKLISNYQEISDFCREKNIRMV